jgi:hypothetical protein
MVSEATVASPGTQAIEPTPLAAMPVRLEAPARAQRESVSRQRERRWGYGAQISNSGGSGAPSDAVKVGPGRRRRSRSSRWNLSGTNPGQVHPEQPPQARVDATIRPTAAIVTKRW